MTKLLLLLAIVVAVVWLLQRARRGERRGRSGNGRRQPPVQQIVECVHCGLHLPRDDAVEDAAGRLFCSDAHRLAGPR